jgi:hypothetical protein
MLQRLHHAAGNSLCLFGALNSNDAADSTHRELLYPEIDNSST